MHKFEFTNIILISDEWETYHRKALTEELIKDLSQWSNIKIVQNPLSLFVHPFTNFKNKILGYFKVKFKTRKLFENTYLYSPVIPFHYLLWSKLKILFYIDYIFIKKQINNFINEKFKNQKIILWVYFPQLLFFLKNSNIII